MFDLFQISLCFEDTCFIHISIRMDVVCVVCAVLHTHVLVLSEHVVRTCSVSPGAPYRSSPPWRPEKEKCRQQQSAGRSKPRKVAASFPFHLLVSWPLVFCLCWVLSLPNSLQPSLPHLTPCFFTPLHSLTLTPDLTEMLNSPCPLAHHLPTKVAKPLDTCYK